MTRYTKRSFGRKSRQEGKHDPEERPERGQDRDEGARCESRQEKGVLSLKPLVFLAQSYDQLIPAEPDVIKL